MNCRLSACGMQEEELQRFRELKQSEYQMNQRLSEIESELNEHKCVSWWRWPFGRALLCAAPTAPCTVGLVPCRCAYLFDALSLCC